MAPPPPAATKMMAHTLSQRRCYAQTNRDATTLGIAHLICGAPHAGNLPRHRRRSSSDRRQDHLGVDAASLGFLEARPHCASDDGPRMSRQRLACARGAVGLVLCGALRGVGAPEMRSRSWRSMARRAARHKCGLGHQRDQPSRSVSLACLSPCTKSFLPLVWSLGSLSSAAFAASSLAGRPAVVLRAVAIEMKQNSAALAVIVCVCVAGAGSRPQALAQMLRAAALQIGDRADQRIMLMRR